jgi:hypothetical protein
MTTKPVNAAEAGRIGSRVFFSGKPCKHGHIAERQTISGSCYACMKVRAAKRTKAKRIEMRELLAAARAGGV